MLRVSHPNPQSVAMSEGDQSLVETQPLELYGYEHIVLEESKAREELLWGLLFPCCNAAEKIELKKTKSQYAFGRSPLDSADGKNDIVIPGLKISSCCLCCIPWAEPKPGSPISGNFHCTISWTGSEVVVTDLSSNGTWVSFNRPHAFCVALPHFCSFFFFLGF
jgi:hypothetical protein